MSKSLARASGKSFCDWGHHMRSSLGAEQTLSRLSLVDRSAMSTSPAEASSKSSDVLRHKSAPSLSADQTLPRLSLADRSTTPTSPAQTRTKPFYGPVCPELFPLPHNLDAARLPRTLRVKMGRQIRRPAPTLRLLLSLNQTQRSRDRATSRVHGRQIIRMASGLAILSHRSEGVGASCGERESRDVQEGGQSSESSFYSEVAR